jgi:hypothetical protein
MVFVGERGKLRYDMFAAQFHGALFWRWHAKCLIFIWLFLNKYKRGTRIIYIYGICV